MRNKSHHTSDKEELYSGFDHNRRWKIGNKQEWEEEVSQHQEEFAHSSLRENEDKTDGSDWEKTDWEKA